MSKALARSAASAPARITEARAAEMFTAAYQDAVGGVRNQLKFGAMYAWLEVALKTVEGHGEFQKGDGLKGWIEAKCPKVNYNTARKAYVLAREAIAKFRIPKGTDVYRLLSAPLHELAPRELKARKEIDDAIEGKSANQLEIFFGIRKDPKLLLGAGNQNAAKDLAADPEAQLAAAKLRVEMDCSKAVARVAKIVDNSSVAFLGLQGMRLLAEELDRLSKRTREILDETAKGARP